MNTLDQLNESSTELANHVAAVVRLSNILEDVLKDVDREDVSIATRLAVISYAKTQHKAFRDEHFHPMIGAVNAVVDTVTKLWAAEPSIPAVEPAKDSPEAHQEPSDLTEAQVPEVEGSPV